MSHPRIITAEVVIGEGASFTYTDGSFGAFDEPTDYVRLDLYQILRAALRDIVENAPEDEGGIYARQVARAALSEADK